MELRNSGISAFKSSFLCVDANVFSNNFDSFASDQGRVHTVAVFIHNDTDGSIEVGEVSIVGHEAVGVSSMTAVTS